MGSGLGLGAIELLFFFLHPKSRSPFPSSQHRRGSSQTEQSNISGRRNFKKLLEEFHFLSLGGRVSVSYTSTVVFKVEINALKNVIAEQSSLLFGCRYRHCRSRNHRRQGCPGSG